MTPDNTDTLLSQLKDIHYPDPIGFWPLAVGWWITLFVCLVLAIAIFIAIRYYVNNNRYRWQSLKALDALSQTETKNYTDALAHLIKRTLLNAPKRATDISLTRTEDFKALLAKTMPEEDAELLAVARYKKLETSAADNDRLTQSVRQWIKRHKL